MAIKQDYFPAVKWRQGEYQALLRLPDAAKARLRPLVIKAPSNLSCVTVGHFVSKTKDRVTIALNSSAEGVLGHFVEIPLVSVKRIKRLK